MIIIIFLFLEFNAKQINKNFDKQIFGKIHILLPIELSVDFDNEFNIILQTCQQ